MSLSALTSLAFVLAHASALAGYPEAISFVVEMRSDFNSAIDGQLRIDLASG